MRTKIHSIAILGALALYTTESVNAAPRTLVDAMDFELRQIHEFLDVQKGDFRPHGKLLNGKLAPDGRRAMARGFLVPRRTMDQLEQTPFSHPVE